MYWKTETGVGIQDIPQTYGNALTSTTPRNQHILNIEGLINLFIMKLVSTKKMQGREKNI